MIPRFQIGRFKVSLVNLKYVVEYINDSIAKRKYGYICVSNSRVAYFSNHDEEYCNIQNNSLLTVPDGKPLVWIARNRGFKEMGQVAGNELFHSMLKESFQHGYTHYFYGSTPKTIDLMKSRFAIDYPGVKLVGAVSPPFQPVENYDIDALANEINSLSPTFFWVGLGAPKQERIMALLQPKLKSTICIGVGLVFEYYAGTIKRAPKWARRFGFEWLVRTIQQPKRFKMFAKPFIWTINQLIKSKF